MIAKKEHDFSRLMHVYRGFTSFVGRVASLEQKVWNGLACIKSI